MCSPWRQLALQTFDSIQLTITGQAQFQQLSLWLPAHCLQLQSLSITFDLDSLESTDGFDELATVLEKMTNLRSLSLLNWPDVLLEENHLPVFSALPHLTQLRVHHNGFPAEVVARLPQQLLSLQFGVPQLRSLVRYQAPPWDEDDVNCLGSRVPQLASLDITDTDFPADLLPSLQELTALRELRLKLSSPSLQDLEQLSGLPCVALNISIPFKSRASPLRPCISWLQQQQQKWQRQQEQGLSSTDDTSVCKELRGLRYLRLRSDAAERYRPGTIARRIIAGMEDRGPPSDPTWVHELLPPLAAAMAEGTGVLNSLQSLVLITNYQLPITRWPCQSRAPVGAAPPTRSQLRLQRHTQVPVQAQTIGCHQPTLNPLLANVCQASPFRLAMR